MPFRRAYAWKLSVGALAGALWVVRACAGTQEGLAARPAPRETAEPAPRGVAWPEADVLFRRDRRWLGADAAVSIDLGSERVLWLFGDTFVAPDSDAPSRARATLVRNSVAVQSGVDPSRAKIAFFWRTDNAGKPTSFFPDEAGTWFWPGHGVRVGSTLTIFLHAIERTGEGALDFRSTGWRAVRVDDPEADPAAWMPRALAVPDTRAHGVVGAAVVVEGNHVYAFGVREPGDHAAWLLRWRLDAFVAGDLARPEYWGGEDRGFGSHAPAVVLEGAATELSVSALPGGRGFLEVQSHAFGADGFERGAIALRFAPALTGPWGAAARVYQPPEAARANVVCYAGKAHPELTAAHADLVVTYACNSTDTASLLGDPDLYYPRFVLVDLP